MKLHSIAAIRHSKDFYSAVIRFNLGLFIALYVWVGMSNHDFELSQLEYNTFASFFFIMTLILAADLVRNPDCSTRRYITLFFDITCTSYMITLTGGGASQFLLIYIWLYIAYGTRYGATYLYTAVTLVIVQYNIILIMDGSWLSHTLGSSAQLFVLIIMPFYLHSMLKQLRDAKIAAEAATKAKSNFLATMSHEIRTPMSGIIGMAHLLQSTRPNNQQREYIKALLDASKSLHALIDDILDFSKIEANKLYLQNAPFNLQQTINEVITVLSPNAECHSLELIVYIDPELPASVIGDSQRIKQIVFNLLGNAIKFTEKGEVVLTISEEKTEANDTQSPVAEMITLRFNLIDTGIGISEEQQDHIFDSFTQAEELQIHKFGGTGLGTTISKQLVECMGGKIGLSSVLGSGSHFWFSLPLAVAKKCQYRKKYKPLFMDKKTALLIHNKALYKTLTKYCRFFGFTINSFSTEVELINALQQAVKQKHPFELLIVSSERDQELPFELVASINALDYSSYSVPKKIFLNYLNKDSDNKKSAHSLFDCCISKPVYFEQLADELLQLLVPETVSSKYMTKCNAENTLSLHVLIAEDEDINAMVLGSFLRDAGHSSKRVKDGAQAVAELAKNKYDIAFMDMHMPVMNGIDATRTWREQEAKESHIPIIALTANATKDDQQACLQAGMDDFMTKPITPERLSSAIIKFSACKTQAL